MKYLIIMYRTVLIPDSRDVHIKLPAVLVGKEVEIIANATDQNQKHKRRTKTLPTLIPPKAGRQAGESWNEIEKFYDSIRVDMSSFKFDRDEIHER